MSDDTTEDLESEYDLPRAVYSPTGSRPIPLSKLMAIRLTDRVNKIGHSTAVHYERCIRKFGEFLGRPATIADLTIDSVMDWMEWMVNDNEMRPTTANANAKQIKAIWGWAASRGYLDLGPPSRFKLPEERPIPDSWSPKEMETLFAAAAELPGTIGPHWANDFWTAVLWFAFNTGERAGGIFQLRACNIDLQAGWAEIPAKDRKAERLAMRWWLSPSCIEAIGRIAPRSRGRAFDGLYRFESCHYKAYSKLLASSGLGKGRRKGLQKMRRTVATWITMRGGQPSIWLGHAPKTVAEGHYVDRWTTQTNQRNIWPIDSFDPLEGLPRANTTGATKIRRRIVCRR
ncbi:tyrosine-type recombinase/integrase [Botrimarina mediterranea]|uniref:tyrosine-type recombinase/integrase n=1 Tax=Botrimarina mediterranea TaxID=2528022 RepID=UPI001189D227|nr:site-specific tyrosine recombinase XerD [Planctomycetes bacterium K2D]